MLEPKAICPGGVEYDRINADLTAKQIREEATPNTRFTVTSAQKCTRGHGDHWHVVTPSPARYKGMNKKMRAKQGYLDGLKARNAALGYAGPGDLHGIAAHFDVDPDEMYAQLIRFNFLRGPRSTRESD